MAEYKEAVGKLYSEKESLVILGLTGRTGAGCSTVASILERKYNDLDLEYVNRLGDSEEDKYKFEIIKEYIQEKNRWIPFTKIEGSCVILSYVFEDVNQRKRPSSKLVEFLYELQKARQGISFKIDNYENLVQEIQGLDYIFKEGSEVSLKKVTKSWNNMPREEVEKYFDFYFKDIVAYKERIRKILLKYSCYEEKKKKLQDEPPVKYHLYTYLLQRMGNNIRSSGSPYSGEFNQDKILSFAERLSQLIDLIIVYDRSHGKPKSRICIDAIRNANESNFLKDRYRPYYLLSISVDEDVRRKRLAQLDGEEQIGLDNIEYSSKLNQEELFYHQNISSCFEMADIHLVNEEDTNKKHFFLTWQLIKYITLMIHPGLITPTNIERCMQLAYNVKYSSGCLSRQVGAVVTGKDFSIKSVGWNEVPDGQLSCSLRDVNTYCKASKKECFSEFEYDSEEFRKVMKDIQSNLSKVDLEGRRFAYCFKDIYNAYKKEKNQVYTRALHAEENAFLQISKYGGQGVKEGNLFCTASPCELCAKKAYQLGIENIYYIDPYPGISQRHILNFGEKRDKLKMHLFYGAIGEAYIRLYRPLLAYKDELELVSGVVCKKIAQEGEDSLAVKPRTKDLLYHSIEVELEFTSREIIESRRHVEVEVIDGKFSEFERKLTWTGSSYDNSELLGEKNGYQLIDSKDKVSPYKYTVVFEEEKGPGSQIAYSIRSRVKDEAHLMHEYFAHMVKYPTERLKLSIIIPKGSNLIENVRYKRYADLKMEYEYPDDQYEVVKNEDEGGEKTIYSLEISKPNLFYSYSIEWDFMSVRT